MNLKRYLEQLPDKYRNLAHRVFNGRSKAAAIKLKCIDCMGFENTTKRIKECTAEYCALHKYRPYQK